MSRAAAAMPRVRSFETVARSDVGLVRALNEDNFLARPDVGIWAVADGMGGHQAGEVASAAIVQALEGIGGETAAYARRDAVRREIGLVNSALVARAAGMAPGAVIGSTVAALVVHEDHYACLWAGDSRVYMLRGGALMRITRDHSLVQELLDAGALSEEDARHRRISNVITRAVGASPELELEETHGDILPGDTFLICSDGLTGLVQDYELGLLLPGEDLSATADRLLGLTLERGARDNVTLVLIRACR